MLCEHIRSISEGSIHVDARSRVSQLPKLPLGFLSHQRAPSTDTTDVVSSSIRLSGLFSKHVVDLPEEARASLRVRGRRGPITLGNQYINPI